jgi:hypothetical protein
MTAIAWAYHKGLKIKCGCGIGPDEEVGPGALIRDGLRFPPLGLAVTFGAFWIRRKTCQTAATALDRAKRLAPVWRFCCESKDLARLSSLAAWQHGAKPGIR